MPTLEEATCDNTRTYSLTGLCLRSKLLWKMEINNYYGIVAVEHKDEVYKAYIWSSSLVRKNIGDIFYVIFGNWDDETNSYSCEIHIKYKSQEYIDANTIFKPKYKNKYECYIEYDSYTTPEYEEPTVVTPTRKLKITALLETSDHDGYCSDGECEYNSKESTYIVDVPELLKKDIPIGVLDEETRHSYYWQSLLPEPILNNSGSHYCKISNKCINAKLGLHDYRYTIRSVEIINANKDCNENIV